MYFMSLTTHVIDGVSTVQAAVYVYILVYVQFFGDESWMTQFFLVLTFTAKVVKIRTDHALNIVTIRISYFPNPFTMTSAPQTSVENRRM
jgi:hypothetical protein